MKTLKEKESDVLVKKKYVHLYKIAPPIHALMNSEIYSCLLCKFTLDDGHFSNVLLRVGYLDLVIYMVHSLYLDSGNWVSLAFFSYPFRYGLFDHDEREGLMVLPCVTPLIIVISSEAFPFTTSLTWLSLVVSFHIPYVIGQFDKKMSNN